MEWTAEEDALLKEGIKMFGQTWPSGQSLLALHVAGLLRNDEIEGESLTDLITFSRAPHWKDDTAMRNSLVQVCQPRDRPR